MKLCETCRRHVRPGEGACPFCGRSLRTTGAARLGAVVLLGALEAACSGRPLEETASDGATTTTSTSSTSSSSSTSGEPVPSTGSPGTSSTTIGETTAISSTGELSSTSDSDSNDPGCSFYGGCPTDFGSSNLECSTWEQDCPEGQKCMPFSGDNDNALESTRCVPIARDPGQPGEPCTVEGSPVSGIDSCDLGSLCWNVDPQTLAGHCAALCTGPLDDPDCADDHSCIGPDDLFNVCTAHCDPLAPTCGPDEVCIPHPTDPGAPFVCIVDASGDGGALFEPCSQPNGCDPGFICLESFAAVECDQNELGCCLPWCDLEMPACTGEGAVCINWYEPGQAPPGLEDVGACSLVP